MCSLSVRGSGAVCSKHVVGDAGMHWFLDMYVCSVRYLTYGKDDNSIMYDICISFSLSLYIYIYSLMCTHICLCILSRDIDR